MCLLLSLALLFTGLSPAKGEQTGTLSPLIDLNSQRYRDLLTELTSVHGFSEEQLAPLFTGLHHNPRVLKLMDAPGEAKPYPVYRQLFLSGRTIAAGRNSLARQQELFDRVEETFGVDRAVIVAIWGIESRFGTNTGGFSLFRTLNTLFDAYPRRSDFFRNELIQFLILCRDNAIDPLSVTGSYAGAFGQAQFMPSSFNRYAVDFDGDGRKDLLHSLPDIFASIANYLAEFGWRRDTPLYAELGNTLYGEEMAAAQASGAKVDWRLAAKAQGVPLPPSPDDLGLSIIALERTREGKEMRYLAGYPNFQAITAYNRSSKYAMVVSELAEALTEGR
jgi:membrane-bound lytic murein transglycosylase B